MIAILIIIILALAVAVGYLVITKTVAPQNQNKDIFQNNQNQKLSENENASPEQSPLQILCEKNGGKFLGVVEVTDGRNSQVCLFPEGKYCEEFGYNKCVESKGNWKP